MPAPSDTAVARVVAQKRALRQQMRTVRAHIAEDGADRAVRSARIWASILAAADLGGAGPSSELVRIGRVMLFDGLPTEPDTGPWLAWCRNRGLDVYLPEVDGPDLRVGPGDIDPARLDLVVVPGLAFTVDGHRLGQGGGHYDRFLRQLRPGCMTVGACFAEQVVADLPVEPHDLRVDAVATDA